RHGTTRRTLRFHNHAHELGRTGRHRFHAGHQLPGSRHRRREPGRGAAGCAERRRRGAQDDEFIVFLRSPSGRRHARSRVHPVHSRSARMPLTAFCGVIDMQSTNVLVLGGGPGGYVAAIRTAQAGLDTVLVERAVPGGTCLNIGCIPSKALIHAADEFHRLREGGKTAHLGIVTSAPSLDVPRLNAWKQGIVTQLTGGVRSLLKRAGVRVIQGDGMVLDGKTVEVTGVDGDAGQRQRIVCQHLVLATGSAPAELPMLPFGGRVITSTEALEPDTLPATMAVIGGGYIGVELGMAYAKLGTKVTLIEAQERILPSWDAALSRPVERRLKALGVDLLLNTRLEEGDADLGRLRLRDAGDAQQSLQADRILVAVGRRPRSAEAGIDRLMLDMDGRYIRVDEQCRSSMRQVWAIGDITG